MHLMMMMMMNDVLVGFDKHMLASVNELSGPMISMLLAGVAVEGVPAFQIQGTRRGIPLIIGLREFRGISVLLANNESTKRLELTLR